MRPVRFFKATTLALTIAILAAITMPLGYFVLGFHRLSIILNIETEADALIASQMINANPDYWIFEYARLQEFLSRRLIKSDNEIRRIVDPQGQTVAQNQDLVRYPFITRSRNLYDSGKVVARLEIVRSLRPLLGETILVAIFGCLLIAAIYFPLKKFVLDAHEEAEKALRESEARFRSLFENMTEGVALHELIYDDRGREVDYRILSTNPAYEKQAGINPQQVVGKLATQAYGTDAPPYLETYAQVARTGQPFTFEAFFPPIKRYFHISVTSSMPGQFFTVFQDITARKQMEETLRDNEEFLSDIFNSFQDGLSILDPDLNIIRVNPAMEKFSYGRPLVGSKCYEAYHHRSAPCDFCPVRQTLLTGEAAREIVTEHLPDGSDRFMEIQTFPLKDRSSGRVQAVIEYVRNVTERKRAEEERLKYSKIESLATLAGGIAHDFNNILTAILGNIGLAALDGKIEPKARERLAKAEQACLRAQALSQQLLTFSKGGVPIKKIISIPKLLKESAGLTLSGSKALCEFFISEDLWPVEADEGQISQVFNNLLINADQAMPEGGIIRIGAENMFVAENSELPLPGGIYVKITIADKGLGIPPQYLDKIFDPYFTTKQKGSGLGLATAYSIIKNHAGLLEVESQIESGSTLTVYLPASKAGAVFEKQEAEPAGGKGVILVMDDEEMVRDVFREMLSRLGYKGDFAADGSQAVEKFVRAKEAEQPFAAVILDLTVPGGMGGKETIRQLLKIDPQVKAIVSSGYSDDPIMADFQKYGFCDVIAKPYKILELSRILKRAVG